MGHTPTPLHGKKSLVLIVGAFLEAEASLMVRTIILAWAGVAKLLLVIIPFYLRIWDMICPRVPILFLVPTKICPILHKGVVIRYSALNVRGITLKVAVPFCPLIKGVVTNILKGEAGAETGVKMTKGMVKKKLN